MEFCWLMGSDTMWMGFCGGYYTSWGLKRLNQQFKNYSASTHIWSRKTIGLEPLPKIRLSGLYYGKKLALTYGFNR